MAFVLDDIFLPATLSAPPMTDDEFASFCTDHLELFFEMTAEGELIVMPPNDSIADLRNTQILFQLELWSR
jgi:Uma2 family endonuclease